MAAAVETTPVAQTAEVEMQEEVGGKLPVHARLGPVTVTMPDEETVDFDMEEVHFYVIIRAT